MGKKRVQKRQFLILGALSVAMAFGNCQAFAAQNLAGMRYADVNEHWASEEILRWSDLGVLRGDGESFRPNDTITRGEMAVILNQVMNYQRKADNTYTDLGQSFYTDAVLKATASGIMANSGTELKPEEPITRQEAVVMMAKALSIPSEGATSFLDDEEIADWAKGYIGALQTRGLIFGSEGKFSPSDPITRAQAVKVLDNMISALYSTPGEFSQNAEKDVVINTSGVTLSDSVIEGDLILTEGISDGEATLKNVTVKGETKVLGGGIHTVKAENCTLNKVTIDNKLNAVRFLTEGTTTVKNLEAASPTVLEGSFSEVTIASAAEITVKGDVASLNVSENAAGAMLTVTKEGSVGALAINGQTSLKTEGAIKSVSINPTAPKTTLSGNGKVSEVTVNADNASINTKDGTIKVSQGVKNTASNGKQIAAGTTQTPGASGGSQSSSDSGSSSSGGGGSSSGGGGSSSGGGQTTAFSIEKVESVKNGLVRLKLNKKTEAPLTSSAFSIICTGGGKDMTILSVHTEDNITYDLTTAFYNDNTYNIEVTLPDGKRIEKDFVSKYDCPELKPGISTRLTEQSASFSYVSDMAGEFYYALSPNQMAKARSVLPEGTEPTVEQLLSSGTKTEMKPKSNTVTLNELNKDTSYTLYYAAKGDDGTVTPLKSVLIEAKPKDSSSESAITIVKAGAFCNIKDFFDENYWFEFELSQPTSVALTVQDFVVTCPAMANITLGRLETTDNKNYKVFMPGGYGLVDNNNFTVIITFPDGKTAENTFYVDLTAPDLVSFEGETDKDGNTKLTFRSDEDGFVYYKIYDDVPQDVSVKDPSDIYATGTKIPLSYGTNTVTISGAEGKWFCTATEDEAKNHVANYNYFKVPAYDNTEPEVPEETLEILSVTANTSGSSPIITVTFNKEQSLGSIKIKEVTNIGGKGLYSSSYDSENGNSGTVLKIKIQGLVNPLPAGTHTVIFNVVATGKELTASFETAAAQKSETNETNEMAIDLEQKEEQQMIPSELIVPAEEVKEADSIENTDTIDTTEAAE